jgi:hypothetical protein
MDATTCGYVIMGRRITPLAALIPAEKQITPCSVSVARVSFADCAPLKGATTGKGRAADAGSAWKPWILRLGAAGWLRAALFSILG